MKLSQTMVQTCHDFTRSGSLILPWLLLHFFPAYKQPTAFTRNLTEAHSKPQNQNIVKLSVLCWLLLRKSQKCNKDKINMKYYT